MRILIIAVPRSGSTSLMNKIAKEKKLTPLFEPFDGTDRVVYNGEDNVVVKTIVSHHNDNLNLSNQFDEVILLSRKNVLECVESHAYHTYFSKKKNYHSNTPYLYEETPLDIFKLCYSDILKWNREIKEISVIRNIPITYYEDIFDQNSEERLRKGDKIKNTNKLI